MSGKRDISKPVVYAYGFDEAGFPVRTETFETETFHIRFVGYRDKELFEKAVGIIFPSGIFEGFVDRRDQYGIPQPELRGDLDLLAEREKQVSNAIHRGSWVCCLLQRVNNGRYGDWKETDLGKKLLNMCFNSVLAHDPRPHVKPTTDEFRRYFELYGISQTSFGGSREGFETRILATSGRMAAAAAVGGNLFFLPFFTTHKDADEVTQIVTLAVDSVQGYKRRNDVYLPEWVTAIRFRTETKIQEETEEAEAKLARLCEASKEWGRYKGILCTSGQNLNMLAVNVFRRFFHLELKSDEQFIEDAIIYDGDGSPLYVVEIKGVNGGVKRENVNQVDSHRERLGLSSSLHGLLVINDFMGIENFEERKQKTFDSEILAHARRLNVKILRTTILIDLMLRHEESPDRKALLLHALQIADPLVGVD